MTQLIINNSIYLPETTKNKYRCYPALLSQAVDMITGRRVLEVRGRVWMIEYEYDYMGNGLMRQLNQVLRGDKAFTVAFLPDSGNEMLVSEFLTESFPIPEYAFSRTGAPYWHNVAFTLREVKPHD